MESHPSRRWFTKFCSNIKPAELGEPQVLKARKLLVQNQQYSYICEDTVQLALEVVSRCFPITEILIRLLWVFAHIAIYEVRIHMGKQLFLLPPYISCSRAVMMMTCSLLWQGDKLAGQFFPVVYDPSWGGSWEFLSDNTTQNPLRVNTLSSVCVCVSVFANCATPACSFPVPLSKKIVVFASDGPPVFFLFHFPLNAH